MRLDIDNTTRFFSVVGAPYIAESHFDDGHDECSTRRDAHRDAEFDAAFAPTAATANGWLRDCR